MKVASLIVATGLLGATAWLPAAASCDGFQGCSLDCPCTDASAALMVGSPPPSPDSQRMIRDDGMRRGDALSARDETYGDVTTGSIRGACSANTTQNRYGLVRGTSTHKAGVC